MGTLQWGTDDRVIRMGRTVIRDREFLRDDKILVRELHGDQVMQVTVCVMTHPDYLVVRDEFGNAWCPSEADIL